jgi:hypothetical protein
MRKLRLLIVVVAVTTVFAVPGIACAAFPPQIPGTEWLQIYWHQVVNTQTGYCLGVLSVVIQQVQPIITWPCNDPNIAKTRAGLSSQFLTQPAGLGVGGCAIRGVRRCA